MEVSLYQSQGASRDLCAALASVAVRVCTTHVHPSSIAPLLACCLIALDKHPGVHPIGIVDTACQIKAVLSIIKPDIQDATGCQQMCGGQICGIEAAVHAARQAFDSENCESHFLVNTYRAPTELFVDNDVILLQEGTTQGDPLAMAMYSLATIPLI